MIDTHAAGPTRRVGTSRTCAARRSSGSRRSRIPTWVALCARLLSGSGVGVCSVVGPLGATTADVKRAETQRAIFDGAREIDTVINVGALKSGDLRVVERDIEAVVLPCRDCDVLSKVIIEAALLTDDEKVTACTLAKAAGADYVKTSTGFGPGGATAADVALMPRGGRRDGCKPPASATRSVTARSRGRHASGRTPA